MGKRHCKTISLSIMEAETLRELLSQDLEGMRSLGLEPERGGRRIVDGALDIFEKLDRILSPP
jgi:hypothetical protein